MKRISALLLSSIIVLSCTISSNPYKIGKSAYLLHCSSCHGEEGEGFKELYPPLNDIESLTKHKNKLACWIRYGNIDTLVIHGKSYDATMPPNYLLDDITICNILNYIGHSWGNDISFDHKEISAQLNACKTTASGK